MPAVRLAETQAHQGARAFVYEFGWQPPTFDGQLGACHASELPFVFDNLADPAFIPLIGTDPPQELADALHSAWVAFATTGDPGWPTYLEHDRAVMMFDTDSSVAYDPRSTVRRLWEGRR